MDLFLCDEPMAAIVCFLAIAQQNDIKSKYTGIYRRNLHMDEKDNRLFILTYP